MSYEIKEAMARFKKLQRKYKQSGDVRLVKELTKLDKQIAEKNTEWIISYGKFFT